MFTAEDVAAMAMSARHLQVHLRADDTLTVDGIPASLSEHALQHVARLAADAALAQLHRVQKVRPTPSRDDRRLLTKVAREAVAAEARRLASGQQELPFAA